MTHFPWSIYPDFIAPDLAREYREGKPWYGSESALDTWVPWLTRGLDG